MLIAIMCYLVDQNVIVPKKLHLAKSIDFKLFHAYLKF